MDAFFLGFEPDRPRLMHRIPTGLRKTVTVCCAIAVFIVCAEFIPYGAAWSLPAMIALNVTFRLIRRRRENRPPVKSVPDVKDRTTAEIGEAWMLTSLLLSRSPSPSDRLHLCHVRDAYLCELAERDPDGFERWVTDSLAGTESRPDAYIRAGTGAEAAEQNSWRRVLRHPLSRSNTRVRD